MGSCASLCQKYVLVCHYLEFDKHLVLESCFVLFSFSDCTAFGLACSYFNYCLDQAGLCVKFALLSLNVNNNFCNLSL
jgi:hypothetical protein